MKALSKILTAGVGVAALVGGAAPAAAQYGYGGGDVLGAIINSVLGQNRYAYGNYGTYGYDPQRERYLVEQCARATETRIQRNYGTAGYNQYGYGGSQYGYGGQGYNQGYNAYSQARIVNITRIERRSNGGVKIFGLATSGRGYSNNGYGGYGGYGGQYGGQYGGGYGYNANAGADLSFDCTIGYNGRIMDIDVNRASYNYGYRGY